MDFIVEQGRFSRVVDGQIEVFNSNCPGGMAHGC